VRLPAIRVENKKSEFRSKILVKSQGRRTSMIKQFEVLTYSWIYKSKILWETELGSHQMHLCSWRYQPKISPFFSVSYGIFPMYIKARATWTFMTKYPRNFFFQDNFYETDWGVCNWPWQLLTLGKADCPLYVTSNRWIPVTDILAWSVVVFFA